MYLYVAILSANTQYHSLWSYYPALLDLTHFSSGSYELRWESEEKMWLGYGTPKKKKGMNNERMEWTTKEKYTFLL